MKRKPSWTKEIMEIRLSAMCGSAFKLLYHIAASVALFMLVGDSDWLPKALYGSGTVRERLFDHEKLVGLPVSEGVRIYYRFALGYHLQEMIVLIFVEMSKPSYYEMLLHHLTTLFLIIWSYSIGYQRVGVLVLIVHYVSDVPVYTCKVFVDTHLKIVTVSGYAMMLTLWGYLRLYVLPFVIMKETSHESYKSGAGYNTSFYLLLVLVVMHAYWYALFLQMGYVLIVSGETKDTQARLPSQQVLKGKKA
jgi:ceramide synthetase